MASQEVVSLTPRGSQELVEGTILPHVDICVTADVHVIQYDTSLASVDNGGPKAEIVARLSAVFEEPSEPDTGIHSVKSSAELHNIRVTDFAHSEHTADQPVLRRSKKSTQLNYSTKFRTYSIGKKSQIDRTVLLPYLGCTTRNESFNISRDKSLLVTSSKSWERIEKSSKTVRTTRLYQSQSLNKLPQTKKATVHPGRGNQGSPLKDSSTNSFRERELPKLSYSAMNGTIIRKFYYVTESNPGFQVLFDDEKSMSYLCTPIIDQIYDDSSHLAINFPDKYDLNKNITGFEQELFAPPANLYPKATRNVSILHKPRSRNVATSTTSLNNQYNMGHPDNSIKGLLMPYISTLKEFPSELVLKLMPKKDVLENKVGKGNANELKAEVVHSSTSDLLVPVICTSPKRKKKKTFFFGYCFSKSKKQKAEPDYNDKDNSNGSSSKEVYFPSVVEVYKNKQQRKLPREVDSDIVTADSSSYCLDKKRKK